MFDNKMCDYSCQQNGNKMTVGQTQAYRSKYDLRKPSSPKLQ